MRELSLKDPQAPRQSTSLGMWAEIELPDWIWCRVEEHRGMGRIMVRAGVDLRCAVERKKGESVIEAQHECVRNLQRAIAALVESWDLS